MNEHRSDKLLQLEQNNIRIFNINTNGLDLGQNKYLLFKLCLTIKKRN